MLSRTRKVMFLSRKASLLGPDFRSFCRPKQNYLSIQRENTYFTREICVFYKSTRKPTKYRSFRKFTTVYFVDFEEKDEKHPHFSKMSPISKFCPNFEVGGGFAQSGHSRPSNSGSPEWLLGRAKNRSRVFWKCYGVSRELRFQKSEVFLSENEFPTRNRSF